MWDDSNDKIMEILDELESKECVFPVYCPVCGEKEGHLCIHRYDERHGGIWIWCSNCCAYSHMSGIIPDWASWSIHCSPFLKGDNIMARYAFPAIFTKEAEGGVSVGFPDLDGCFTCGDDLADGIFMAEDALALFLYDLEETGAAIPAPTAVDAGAVGAASFVVPIACDTMVYRNTIQ